MKRSDGRQLATRIKRVPNHEKAHTATPPPTQIWKNSQILGATRPAATRVSFLSDGVVSGQLRFLKVVVLFGFNGPAKSLFLIFKYPIAQFVLECYLRTFESSKECARDLQLHSTGKLFLLHDITIESASDNHFLITSHFNFQLPVDCLLASSLQAGNYAKYTHKTIATSCGQHSLGISSTTTVPQPTHIFSRVEL